MAESARESEPDAILMSEVQIYDCLFNIYSRDFKEKYKKIHYWQKVGDAVGLTPESAEKSFMGLRQQYTRHWRQLKSMPSGSGRDAEVNARRKKYNCME